LKLPTKNATKRLVFLAKNLFWKEDLNLALQKTLDRLIFLRICEDRDVEIYGKLKGVACV